MAVYLGSSSSFDFAPWDFCADDSTDFIEGIQNFLFVSFFEVCEYVSDHNYTSLLLQASSCRATS